MTTKCSPFLHNILSCRSKYIIISIADKPIPVHEDISQINKSDIYYLLLFKTTCEEQI